MMKKRNWTTIVYPDSVKEDWINELQETGLEIAISPLHDQDIDYDGKIKKPHYHVILCYSGPTTKAVVQDLSKTYLSGTLVKPIESIRGMYRYLTHRDNPEKAQYAEKDIILLNGFDPSNIMSNADESALLDLVLIYIKDHDIYYYSDLIDKLMLEDNPDLHHIAKSKTIFFNTYLSSRRIKLKELQKSS